jgi:hypothetical protein
MDLQTIGEIHVMPQKADRFKGPSDVQASMLSKAEAFMDVFSDVDRAMPSSYIRMFLRVAREPGKGITEYANDLDIYQAVGSRILLEIGPKARSGGEGLGLVEAVSHPSDMRTKRYYLTRQGHKIVAKLMNAMGVEDSQE